MMMTYLYDSLESVFVNSVPVFSSNMRFANQVIQMPLLNTTKNYLHSLYAYRPLDEQQHIRDAFADFV